MTKENLIQMLNRLPIENPQVEEVTDLFPHLSTDEINKFLSSVRSRYAAIPALRINGGYHVVNYSPAHTGEIKVRRGDSRTITGTKNYPAVLSWAYAGRTPESYASGNRRVEAFASYKQMDEAIAFARQNWAPDLIIDNWADFIEIYLDDPTDIILEGPSKGSPKAKATIGLATTRPWNAIVNDHSKPQSQVIDDAIAQITADRFIASELKGFRGMYSEFNCAYDGAGLGLSGCGECGNRFRDNGIRSGWSTPLPPKVADYLVAQGFKFGQDPAIARQKEAQRFEQYAKR